jgi:hypothetical protein
MRYKSFLFLPLLALVACSADPIGVSAGGLQSTELADCDAAGTGSGGGNQPGTGAAGSGGPVGTGSAGSGGPVIASCGNGFCETGEDHATCAGDCCETNASGACI